MLETIAKGVAAAPASHALGGAMVAISDRLKFQPPLHADTALGPQRGLPVERSWEGTLYLLLLCCTILGAVVGLVFSEGSGEQVLRGATTKLGEAVEFLEQAEPPPSLPSKCE